MPILVAIPFCRKDAELVSLNLELAAALDDKVPFDCLLAHDSSDSEFLPAIQEKAGKVFRTVFVHEYTPWKGDQNWPTLSNYAWQQTARHIEASLAGKYHGWLWWEYDATPLKQGWLSAIWNAFAKGKQPFAGFRVQQGADDYMNGVGVWPSQISTYLPNSGALITRVFPFDRAAARESLRRFTKLNGLLEHVIKRQGGGPGMSFDRATWNSWRDEHPHAALLHACTDGSLARVLLGKDAPAVEISHKTCPPVWDQLTVVITAHARPELLKKAVRSCLNAGVKHMVVAASGIPGVTQLVNGEVRALNPPGIQVLEHSADTPSNQSWKVGVEAVKTQYVALLHDDDLMLPEYGQCAEAIIASGLPFGLMQARNHGVPDYLVSFASSTGPYPSSLLLEQLLKPRSLSISPIIGIFKRDDLAAWLGYAGGLPEECYYRPGFLVGNDLLIWIKAAETYPQFMHVATPGMSFGHWEGSTTVADLANENRLFGIYDRARAWHRESKPVPESLGLHILTIVLDGMPMIAHHLPVLNRLGIPWHWSIVEGAARNIHCTRWCKPQPSRLSNDGTTEYLESIAHHPHVTVYRKASWAGKIEMVNAPLGEIQEPCVLLQMDADEFWTAQQLNKLPDLFACHPAKTHAMFWCRYWFGPDLVMETRNCYGNNPYQDWKRAWRFKPGMKFERHEPPGLPGEKECFTHAETEAAGLVFEHYGYAHRKQVAYKESFYGYKGAVTGWEALQQAGGEAIPIARYLPWVKDEKCVARRI